MTSSRRARSGQRGAALILALLVSIAIAGMALGAVVLASGANLSTFFTVQETALQAAANGGLEVIRDSVNRGDFDALLPFDGFTTLATNAPVTDAHGAAIPGLTRSLYVGRTGGRTGGAATAGQYGSNFASGLVLVNNPRGGVAARRLLMTQDSWAKYVVAVNNWSGPLGYGCNESIAGPLHSNNILRLGGGCSSPKTLFTGPVTVVNSIVNQSSGDFRAGATTGVSPLPWPSPARIALMRQYAQEADAANGDYDLTSAHPSLGSKTPAIRIEFLTIDVNGDGNINWDEGFMRVWDGASAADSVLAYATGRRWPTTPPGVSTDQDPNMLSRNCGAVTQIDGAGPLQFFTAQQVYDGTTGTVVEKRSASRALLSSLTRRCYLGGAPQLFSPATGDTLTPDETLTSTPALTNNFGTWRRRRTGPFGALTGVRSGDAPFLIPLGANSNFKGVIFVQGDVAISGRLRGRVSVVATGNIILADDILYQIAPGSKCDQEGDILGSIATKDVIIEDNNLQTPFKVGNTVYGGFDDTNDANYNTFLFAAGTGGTDGNWYAEGVTAPFSGPPVHIWNGATVDPSAVAQRCTDAPNGCVRVTGGLALGRFDNGTYYPQEYGWAEAHSYDECGATSPPPYFPTTGRFSVSRYYEIDPVWLRQMTIAEYFRKLQAQ